MWHSELALESVAAIHGERRRRAEARRLAAVARAGSRRQGVPLPGWLAHVRPAPTGCAAEVEAARATSSP